MPRSPDEMRPSGTTAEASTTTSPAPPWARLPRCTRCQSVAKPSSLEYWHIGLTPMRLRKVTPRRVIGSNRDVVMRAFLATQSKEERNIRSPRTLRMRQQQREVHHAHVASV